MNDIEHKCLLPPEEDPLVKYISSGYCVQCRRSLKKCTMVSETNPRSKMYLKSSFNIRREKIRHLKDHYYMIHPFSSLKYYWELFMIIVMITLMTIVPILICMPTVWWPLLYFRFSLDIACLVDVVIVFNSGYLDTRTKKVILKRKSVAINYLKTWFTFDLLSVLNMDLVLAYWIKSEESDLWTLKFFNLLKILRMFTLIIYMNRFREFHQYSIFRFKIFKLLLILLLLLLWATCVLFILATESREEWLLDPSDENNLKANLVKCFVEVFDFFLLIDHIPPKSLKVLGFEIFCLIIGLVLQLFFLSQIRQAVDKSKTFENKYNEKKEQLHSYLQVMQVSNDLIQKSHNYFDFRFQKSYFKESEVLQTLSSTLRDEINFHICQTFLANVDILKDIPISSIIMLTSLMEEEIYLPNDVIIKAGELGDCMYFVSSGMLAFYTPGGQEIGHITDGGNFGEVCMLSEHHSRIASVVAVDYCDLYVLSRKNFLKAVDLEPALYEKTVEISQRRMAEVVFAEHTRNRPCEFYDLRTPEGIHYFKKSLYDM